LVFEMTRPVLVTSLGSEFDNFLFAPIREDGNGMLLSVISALARLGLDPWEEATNLAALPGEVATKRLVSLMVALPGGPSAHQDAGAIAARLNALLPRRAGSNIASRKALRGDEVTKLRTGIFMYAVFIVVMLATQGVVASHQHPAQVDNVHAPAASVVSPNGSPPKSGG
jgi:hypothetical protein